MLTEAMGPRPERWRIDAHLNMSGAIPFSPPTTDRSAVMRHLTRESVRLVAADPHGEVTEDTVTTFQYVNTRGHVIDLEVVPC
jgi:hypothetical protein